MGSPPSKTGERCREVMKDAGSTRAMSHGQSTQALVDSICHWPTSMTSCQFIHGMEDACTPWMMLDVVEQGRLPEVQMSCIMLSDIR